jgi:hypothetical protein
MSCRVTAVASSGGRLGDLKFISTRLRQFGKTLSRSRCRSVAKTRGGLSIAAPGLPREFASSFATSTPRASKGPPTKSDRMRLAPLHV